MEMNYSVRHLLRLIVIATARQQEQALPAPIGVILPATAEHMGLTHIHGLPVILLDTEQPGLIIPLEEA